MSYDVTIGESWSSSEEMFHTRLEGDVQDIRYAGAVMLGADGPGSNYTYNVASMYHAAFGHAIESIIDLNGMKCGKAAKLIAPAVDKMTRNPEVFRAMNPENGWGDYEGALSFLNGILVRCRLHPEEVLYVS